MIPGVGPDAPITTNNRGGKQADIPYRCDLVPARAVLHVAAILKPAARKYGEDNWRKIGVQEHVNHALTHLFALQAGDGSDDHLGHATCRLMMALEQQLRPGTPAAQAVEPDSATPLRSHPEANDCPQHAE